MKFLSVLAGISLLASCSAQPALARNHHRNHGSKDFVIGVIVGGVIGSQSRRYNDRRYSREDRYCNPTQIQNIRFGGRIYITNNPYPGVIRYSYSIRPERYICLDNYDYPVYLIHDIDGDGEYGRWDGVARYYGQSTIWFEY